MWISGVVLLAVLAATVTAKNSYVALVPRTISPNTKLTFTVQLLHNARAKGRTTTLTATLMDRDNKTVGIPYMATLSRVDFVTASIQVPAGITWNQYQLELNAKGGYVFKNRTSLWFRPKSVSIFVQSDKAIYRSGETVNYRVFIINSGLKPVGEKMNIEIFDKDDNKISEQVDVIAPLGITNSLKLSDLVKEGRWSIVVTLPEYNNLKERYNFDVEDYVLPKFDVACDIPESVYPTDTTIAGTVSANYNFGKPVKGHAIITLRRRYSGGMFDVQGLRTQLDLIDGKADFSFTMKMLNRLTRNIEYESLQVECTVVEPLTLQNYTATDTSQFRTSSVRLEFYPNLPNHFKADQIYPIMLRVSQSDEKPLPPTTDKVKVSITYFTEEIPAAPRTLSVQNYKYLSPFKGGSTIFLDELVFDVDPTDGTVQFEHTFPGYVATVKVKAEFRDVKTFLDIQRFRSASEAILNLELMNTGPLKVGQTMNGKLTPSDTSATVTYLVLAKGKIVHTRKVEMARKSATAVFQFPITSEMSPSAQCLAYYVRSDGEIIADAANFVVDDLFQNKVEVSFDIQTSVEPTTNVNFEIKADPNSTVNVLVVDKGVKLLKDGNDITQARVRNELNRFPGSFFRQDTWGIIMPWRPRADDSCDLLNSNEIRMMTDTDCFSFNLWSRQRRVFSGGAGFGGRSMAMSAESNDMMGGSPGGGSSGGSPPRVRKLFPETWIWKSVTTDSRGRAQISATVPDTIGQWQGSAFALNPASGLGVSADLANLTVIQPFFFNLVLPTHVIRGEEMVLQVIIFNYAPTDVTVTVLLKASDQFSVVTFDAAGTKHMSQGEQSKCLTVKKDVPTPVYFTIIPEKIGDILIEVESTGRSAQTKRNVGDAVRRSLKVKAEGEEKEQNFPFLVSHQQRSEQFNDRVSLTDVLPVGLISDSLRVQVTVTGDLFGKSLNNLENLIKLPKGCGEQNILIYAPAAFAAKYLKDTGRLATDQASQDKIRSKLNTGYQRQLVYFRSDGSFSAFGEADDEGSAWLTAFVIKSFAQANRLNMNLYIDPNVIQKAVNFLLLQQNRAGAFSNTGKVHHKAMQGGSNENIVSLTAFMLIALEEVKMAEFTFQDALLLGRINSAIAQATSYLENSVGTMTTTYEYAIGAYALSLVSSPSASALFDKLDKNKIVEAPGRAVHWESHSYALQIEIASYALLAYAKTNRRPEGLNVLFWLVEKRNPFGGFSSTQDTVIALQALSEFAAQIYSKIVDMMITVKSGTAVVASMTLTSLNHDLLQFVDLPRTSVSATSILTIEASGAGLALIEASLFYNVEEDSTPKDYDLFLNVESDTSERFILQACARFTKVGQKSNMAIMDIGLPSGFDPVTDSFVKPALVKRTEVNGGRFMIYFDEIPETNTCVKVEARRSFIVGNPKPALVFAYSYYEPHERVARAFLPPSLVTYDLCGKCGTGCTACASTPETTCSTRSGRGAGGGPEKYV